MFLDDEKLLDDFSAEQVLLDDALQDRWLTRVVPSALGINDCDGATLTDAQAVRLGPQYAALLRQVQLLEPPLQKRPCRKAAFLLAALRLFLIAAEKNMSAGDGYANRGGDVAL